MCYRLENTNRKNFATSFPSDFSEESGVSCDLKPNSETPLFFWDSMLLTAKINFRNEKYEAPFFGVSGDPLNLLYRLNIPFTIHTHYPLFFRFLVGPGSQSEDMVLSRASALNPKRMVLRRKKRSVGNPIPNLHRCRIRISQNFFLAITKAS